MLSIGRVRRGGKGKRYYLVLHEEDYYLRRGAGEPPGQWVGRQCVRFGLHGLVGEEDFCKLFDAIGPGGERLRRQQKNGRPAFDLTYSVSKDVSIIYMQASPELKRQIEAAIYAAVRISLGYVEDEVCKTRLGAGGSEVVKGDGLAAALFLHLISREFDPQLHIHAVVFNFTRGPDGVYRSLDASKIYEHKLAAGCSFAPSLRQESRSFALRLNAIASPSPSKACRKV